MEFRFERTGTIAEFVLNGRIDSSGSLQLDNALKTWLVPTDLAVLFDMTGVSYMSSAGIRVFSALEKTLHRKNGHLYLCAVQPAVVKVLEITGFHRIFTLCPTREEAVRRCRMTGSPAVIQQETTIPGTAHARLSVDSFPDHEVILKITGSGEKICNGSVDAEDLVPRTFACDEYSAGIGALGDSATESLPNLGELLTIGGAIFWRPTTSTDAPDFLIPEKDAPRIQLHTAFSVAVDGKFHEIIVAEPLRPEGVSLADLFSDIVSHAKTTRKNYPSIISVVMYANINELVGTSHVPLQKNDTRAGNSGPPSPANDAGLLPLNKNKTLISFGICIDTAADLSAFDRDALDAILCQKAPDVEEKNLFLYQFGLVFDAQQDHTTRDITSLVSKVAAQESCIDLQRLCSSTTVSRAVMGVSYISGIVHTDRVPVRITGDCPGWNSSFETITRRLHHGCRELELLPLTGGFSGTSVFRVNAWDWNGRKMMPLVMKLGEWQIIDAEIRGYTNHVKRYIQNNATQVIETERVGDYGGILYNFVGIRGTESKIFSLEDYYLSHTTDEILPVFDSLFRVVLRGWYGQPRLKEIFLYQEYNKFWRYDQIRAYAASHFGAAPDMEEIELPFGLGRSVNPLWFVEKILPDRLSKAFLVYEASVHGDLNMKNVLLDETNNLWLIDFAETRYSHILRDIVKLEAVIKGEMIPIFSRQALAELVSLDVQFLSARSLSDIPQLPHNIQDPVLEKAFRCVQKLRRYADLVTLLDDDITQYYLGLLPYTLNLLSYTSVNEYAKEYGWISASLICQRLMEKRP